ncbi:MULTISPECIES: hypothetical protein [unclassified Thioalkalivibrio]|uniref:hypothetical protein n=1 Tax=unclassified Thioalkalivibrio TaxID=2621013 RepID=UPI0003629C07|nr:MULTISPECIES: hypothetical protein [unclassified Thioalkalivibrio]
MNHSTRTHIKSLALPIALAFSTTANADEVTRIHLEQHNGYFAAQETLADLKAGEYEFIVTNQAGKVAGFQVQNHRTNETLAMFPLQPGETGSARVTISEDGFRYRCPINPTPWYELDNVGPAGD